MIDIHIDKHALVMRAVKTEENIAQVHEHCYHLYTGPLYMSVPDGHVVLKCCKCPKLKTTLADCVPLTRSEADHGC